MATTCGPAEFADSAVGLGDQIAADVADRSGPRIEPFLPISRLGRDHFAHQIAADQAQARLRLRDQSLIVEVDARQNASHGAPIADVPHQSASVDAGQSDDAPLRQIRVQLAGRAEVACPAGPLPDDEPGQMGPAAFDVLGVDAVVADFRIRHGDDLAAVAWVGEDFLVAGHRRVEANFAVDFAVGAECSAGKYRSVFQGKLCWLGRWLCH